MPTFTFTAPDGTNHSIDGPEGATREQAFHMLQLKLGGQPAPAAPAAPQESPGYASDMLRSADAGIGKGLTTVLGLPGDVASLAHDVAPQSVVDTVKAIPGAKWLYNHIPGSEALKATIPTDFSANYNKDADYQPKTAPGRYTKAVAAQVPMMATGMGAAGVIGGGLAGQAAKDATGSDLAEAVGNIFGSIAAPMALARASRRAIMPLLDRQAVHDIGDAGYAEPLLRDTAIGPQATQNLAGDMSAELAASRSQFAPAQAPQVHAAIDRLAARGAPTTPHLTPQQQLQMQMNWQTPPPPIPAAPVSIEELHSFRKTLGTIGRETHDGKPTEQATAAGVTKRVLDRYLDNIPSSDVVRGNPIDAVDALRTANGNWRASSNAKSVEDLIGNAIEDNAGAGSAMNLGNKLRQSFRPLLKNGAAKLRAMGHGDDVIDAVREVNRGDFTTNALRHASNMLGGGGGIGSTIIGHGIASGVGGTAGYQEGGLPGMVAGTVLGAVPGQVLRLAANRRTLAAAQRVQQQLLAQAPANAGIVASNNAARAANSAAYSSAVGRNGIPSSLLQATKLHRLYVGRKNDGR